jgi:hypothetical protein
MADARTSPVSVVVFGTESDDYRALVAVLMSPTPTPRCERARARFGMPCSQAAIGDPNAASP